MNKIEKVKDIYKSIVRIFLKTNEDITYWESQKIMSELSILFPEINFEELKNEVNDEFVRQFEKEINDKFFQQKMCFNSTIVGYEYGNPRKLHDNLPDYDEEVFIVYANGRTEGYDYFGGELTRQRG